MSEKISLDSSDHIYLISRSFPPISVNSNLLRTFVLVFKKVIT